MNDPKPSWTGRARALARRHPALYLLLIVALAFLMGPLMISANNTTAVLYKDF